VTVVLSGEGSDEIFGGYDLYRYMQTIEKVRSILGGTLSSATGQTLKKLNIHPKINKYAAMLATPLEQRYRGISTYDSNVNASLYTTDYKSQLSAQRGNEISKFIDNLFAQTKGKDVLSRMLYFDTKTWLVDDLLIKADRMSMAASLELRVPFLDYRLVEFAATIPSKYKIAHGEGKYLLKKMMEGLLPNEIIYRKKMGFPTPLCMMFKTTLRDYSNERLLSTHAKLHEIIDRNGIQALLNEHQKGKQDHHRVLWQLIVLEEWLQQNG
jgi:asparagine synthase (glutamine-hydrolysing)